MLYIQPHSRKLFQGIGQVLVTAALLAPQGCAQNQHELVPSGPFGITDRKLSSPARASSSEVQKKESQMEATKRAKSTPSDLDALLDRLSKTRDPSATQTLIHEYLHGAYELKPEERQQALNRLQATLEKTYTQVK